MPPGKLSPMKFSVALCTYNGGRFLGDQLESIARQTRLPEELIIFDDHSSDDSQKVIADFQAATTISTKLTVNESNVGSTLNFERAITACSGDVIVLCDQDDIWLPHKLARLEREFRSGPDIGFVFSDARLIDQRGDLLPETLWEAIEFGPRRRRELASPTGVNLLLRRYAVTGATMAFRSQYRDLVLPIPSGWIHDGWIALLIRAVAACGVIEEPLIHYRQHPAQQIGERKRSLYQQYRLARTLDAEVYDRERSRFQAARDRLAEETVFPVRPEVLTALDRKIAHTESRVKMRDRRWRYPLILRELLAGNYGRCSLGWKSLAQDLFL